MNDNLSTFEDQLRVHGKIIYTNVGDSMRPLIKRGRDVMIIERPTGRLKKYAIPLYKRASGKYVLHRILRVRENDYVICGDNCTSKEYGITDREIIGVLTGIIRNGKHISVNDFSYKVYTHLWCDFFAVRVLVLKFRSLIRRIRRKLKRQKSNG